MTHLVRRVVEEFVRVAAAEGFSPPIARDEGRAAAVLIRAVGEERALEAVALAYARCRLDMPRPTLHALATAAASAVKVEDERRQLAHARAVEASRELRAAKARVERVLIALDKAQGDVARAERALSEAIAARATS